MTESINLIRNRIAGWYYKVRSRHFREKISDVSVALFLNSQFIIRILEAYFPFFEKIGVKIIFLFSAFLMLISFHRIVLNKVHVLIPSVIIVYYIFTALLCDGQSAVKLVELVNYSLIPFVLVGTNFRFENVVKCTLIITSPAIIVIDKVFVHYADASREVITMVLCHSVLFTIIAAISYVVFYSYHDNIIERIFYYSLCALNIVYFYELLLFGGRSATLSILLFVCLVMFFRPNHENDTIRLSNTKMLVTAGLILIVGGVVLLFGKNILFLLNQTLLAHDIHIRFIQKTYDMLSRGDLSNGRTDIYKKAIEGFLHSPLIGNGLDMFQANTGYSFPHNFILQLAYDGGMCMLCFVFLPTVICSVILIKKNRYSVLLPWLMLFCVTIPVMFFSGDLWIKYAFWFLVAYSVTNGRFIKIDI